jgi:thiamine kinase-like enzyme
VGRDAARARAARACTLAEAGRHAEAAVEFRAAFAEAANLPGVARTAAASLAAVGDRIGAARLLGLAAAESAGDRDSCRQAATAWLDSGHPEESVPWFRRAGRHEDAAAAARAWQERTGQVPPPGVPDDPMLLEALRRVPLLAHGDWGRMSFTPLAGGRHNVLYRIDSKEGGHVLRLERFPPERWHDYAREAATLSTGRSLGLAPDTLYLDSADGTMLQPFLTGRQLSNADCQDESRLRRIGAMFARLHGGPRLQGLYDLFDLIGPLEAELTDRDRGEFPDLPRIGVWIHDLRRMLRANAVPLAPCHNDPVPANMFDDGQALTLIDWQCAGMADPDYEVGFFLAETAPDQAGQRALLAEYLGRTDHPRASRVMLFQAIARYYWMLFGLRMRRQGQPESAWGGRVRVNLGEIRAMGRDPAMRRSYDRVGRYRYGSDAGG